jgi:hypothetical protein
MQPVNFVDALTHHRCTEQLHFRSLECVECGVEIASVDEMLWNARVVTDFHERVDAWYAALPDAEE